MRRLYFIRHGESELNASGIFSGNLDSPLTMVGIEQSKNAGLVAKELKIDLIASSPFQRALKTAEIISDVIGYPTHKILVSELFAERNFGVLEGRPYSRDIVNDQVEGIEKLNDILARAEAGYSLLKYHPAENILLVSHSAFGRALRDRISDEHSYESGGFRNAEIVQFI